MGDAKIKGIKQFCAGRNTSCVQWTATWVNYRTKMRSLTHKRSSGTGLWQLDDYRHAKLQVQLKVIYTNNSTEVFPHHWSIWLHNKGTPKLPLCLFLSEGLTQREPLLQLDDHLEVRKQYWNLVQRWFLEYQSRENFQKTPRVQLVLWGE